MNIYTYIYIYIYIHHTSPNFSRLLPIFQISEPIFGKMGANFTNFPGMFSSIIFQITYFKLLDIRHNQIMAIHISNYGFRISSFKYDCTGYKSGRMWLKTGPPAGFWFKMTHLKREYLNFLLFFTQETYFSSNFFRLKIKKKYVKFQRI